ncbi:DUF1801 domain-containing protein [Cohnella fermenti]|uniref:DUF1801 domain-containing protein n=1 Tax=Cohnella fermenti TaxID=2565925 RepID=A0A4S4C6E8_9BACL|nr:DUF1801 domain-containing protein [Cohnella fermenti]THF83470.1 DUF1801 domain-containing protein [Cohnella fermenti]
MNPDVTAFIESIAQPWQAELASRLRAIIHEAIPDAAERIQYGKPHFLKNGKYAAVISPSKAALSFVLFNAAELQPPPGLFEPGPPERRTAKFKEGQALDEELLLRLTRQASDTL